MGLRGNLRWEVSLALDGAGVDCSLEAPRPTSLAHCSIPHLPQAPPSQETLKKNSRCTLDDTDALLSVPGRSVGPQAGNRDSPAGKQTAVFSSRVSGVVAALGLGPGWPPTEEPGGVARPRSPVVASLASPTENRAVEASSIFSRLERRFAQGTRKLP